MYNQTDESLDWRKASLSFANNNCVEVAAPGSGTAVRDSQDRHGAQLRFPAPAWLAFVAGLKGV